jgi:hypothetical protein
MACFSILYRLITCVEGVEIKENVLEVSVSLEVYRYRFKKNRIQM